MDQPGSFSPLIYDYLKKFQDDPTSRVFAPLAEAYRKAGLIDEAINIAREGLLVHPQFVGGRVALARALFDKKEYEEVIRELQTLVLDVPDNLVAQKLYADSCLMLGRVTEAMSAYKMLLYFNPKDAEVAKVVSELEAQAYQKGDPVIQLEGVNQGTYGFEIAPLGRGLSQDPIQRLEQKIKRIELLQGLLQKIERYKIRNGAATQG